MTNRGYRWIGYLLLFFIIVIFGSGKMRFELLDVPSLGFMAFGILSACLIGMGGDGLRAALRAWPLNERTIRADTTAMEQMCDLAVTASWMVGIFSTMIGVVVILGRGFTLSGGIIDPNPFARGAAVAVLSVFYAALFALFFAAHRVRARRWLAAKSGEGNENAA